jgi:hypothetical protein
VDRIRFAFGSDGDLKTCRESSSLVDFRAPPKYSFLEGPRWTLFLSTKKIVSAFTAYKLYGSDIKVTTPKTNPRHREPDRRTYGRGYH